VFLGLLLLYEHRSDVYDEDKDAVDEIGLANILVIESSTDDLLDFSTTNESGAGKDPTIAPCIDCLFDVHARVQFGGDSQGIRVFSFYSDSQANAVKWMSYLCKAVGFLQLVPASGGGYVSVVSEAAIIERRELQLKRQVAMMREGAGGDSIRRLASCSALSDARGMNASSPMGRGRGRGRAFRGLTGSSHKFGCDMNSPGKDGSLNRGFHSVPDELEYLSYDRPQDDAPINRKEKMMADVHRNHFKEVPLTGGRGGRGRGGRVVSNRTQGHVNNGDDHAIMDVLKEHYSERESDSYSIPKRPHPIGFRGRVGTGRSNGHNRPF
jgi:hypothetical protein